MNSNNSLVLPKSADKKYHFPNVTKMVVRGYNTIAPEGCEIKSKADAWYVVSVTILSVGLIIPYLIPLLIPSLAMVKREEARHE